MRLLTSAAGGGLLGLAASAASAGAQDLTIGVSFDKMNRSAWPSRRRSTTPWRPSGEE